VKLAIDPGHGMANRRRGLYDPGAVHQEMVDGRLVEYREAQLALVYAAALRQACESLSLPSWMTRHDDITPAPLSGRAFGAAKAGCTGLLSLHFNDHEDDRANGLEVLYGGEHMRELAERMQRRLVAATGLRDRGAKRRQDLGVLRFPGPALLVELGFIANDKDREKLMEPDTVKYTARVMAIVMRDAIAPSRSGQ
jgi:N-acetylmuramoyl-L-alanine amidase